MLLQLMTIDVFWARKEKWQVWLTFNVCKYPTWDYNYYYYWYTFFFFFTLISNMSQCLSHFGKKKQVGESLFVSMCKANVIDWPEYLKKTKTGLFLMFCAVVCQWNSLCGIDCPALKLLYQPPTRLWFFCVTGIRVKLQPMKKILIHPVLKWIKICEMKSKKKKNMSGFYFLSSLTHILTQTQQGKTVFAVYIIYILYLHIFIICG